MATEKPELKLQEVQQPMMVEQRQETIGGIGYTQRPINARTQIRNRYLDGVIAVQNEQDIAPFGSVEITGYTYTKTGNYDFTKGSTDSIIVPENGTYMIIAGFQWLEIMTVGETLHWVLLDGTALYSQNIIGATAFNTPTLSGIENLTKGQEITVGVFHTESEARKIKVKLSLTKLS